MPDESPILSIPYIMPAQAQKHVTHNEAIRLLDVLVQLVVSDRDRTEPPESPPEDGRHIIAFGATGEWSGRAGQIAVRQDGSWTYVLPRLGWRAFVQSEGQIVIHDGAAWIAPDQSVLRAAQLGIGATPDDTNRLSVSSLAVLMNHAGTGVQLKLNKAAPAETASLLFQTGFSGRAEMGTVGGDDFQIKVSPDGAVFHEALVCSGADGQVLVPNGLVVDGALTGSAVVGLVSQEFGFSTGAVIERGAGASGDYVRFADGTQICTVSALETANISASLGALFRSPSVTWAYPRAFAQPPAISGITQTGSAWVVAGAAATSLNVELRLVSAVSAVSPVPFSAIAVGRWY